MKNKVLAFICAIVVCLMSTISCAADRLLPNLKKQEGLTTVYIGKTLLRMAGGRTVVSATAGVVDMDDIVKYLNSVEIVNADTSESVAYLRPIMKNAMAAVNGLNLSMEVNDEDSEVKIYTVSGSSDDKLSRILLVVTEKDEITLIDMQGDIPSGALEDMM